MIIRCDFIAVSSRPQRYNNPTADGGRAPFLHLSALPVPSSLALCEGCCTCSQGRSHSRRKGSTARTAFDTQWPLSHCASAALFPLRSDRGVCSWLTLLGISTLTLCASRPVPFTSPSPLSKQVNLSHTQKPTTIISAPPVGAVSVTGWRVTPHSALADCEQRGVHYSRDCFFVSLSTEDHNEIF